MFKTLEQEVRYLKKGVKRSPDIKERMEVVILSLAHMEHAYRTKHPNATQTFDLWLRKGGGYKDKYLNVLMLPIEGYKKVQESKSRDAYYNEKLAKGLITPFTEADLMKRSFKPRVRTWRDGNDAFKGELIYKPRNNMGFDTWVDWLTDGNTTVRVGENPEACLLKKEHRRYIVDSLAIKGFTSLEIDVIFAYLESGDDRGVQKEIQEHLSITRGKFQSLIRRLNKFLAECGINIAEELIG